MGLFLHSCDIMVRVLLRSFDLFLLRYLLHFFAPDVEIPSRRIIFVIDISVSMIGVKIEQQEKAMLKIVEKLTSKVKNKW